jgi:hypothetical protein
MIVDWISAASSVFTAGIAVYAANVGIKTLKHQRDSANIAVAVNLFDRINGYWDKMQEPNSKPDYCLGQVLAYYETAAALINNKHLSDPAELILKDHIAEVWSKLTDDPYHREIIKKLESSDTSFSELKKFVNAYVPTMLRERAHRRAIDSAKE